ncbi:MAG: hypothetical protein IH944_13865 [Armatimonadetes bacterium]|nr:hypothetical protein [Armatimonadota bacterium]
MVGAICIVAFFMSATQSAQSLQERARAYGFLLAIDEYEQHTIAPKYDSHRFYVAVDHNLRFLPREVYAYWSGNGDRKIADEVLASYEDIMPELWAVTSRPRYYQPGDWNRSWTSRFVTSPR